MGCRRWPVNHRESAAISGQDLAANFQRKQNSPVLNTLCIIHNKKNIGADMEVDKVADKMADEKKKTKGACKKEEEERVPNLVRESWGLVNWAQTFSTRSLSNLCVFFAS